MKKIVLALCLMLVLSLSLTAMATATTPAVPEGIPYEGAWLNVANYFYIYAPVDWLVLEVTEEKAAVGIIASFSNADATQTLDIACAETTEDYTAEQLLTELSADAANGDVDSLEINGNTFVSYERAADGVFGAVFLDPNFYVMHNFAFAPITEEAQATAVAMLLTVNSITPAE